MDIDCIDFMIFCVAFMLSIAIYINDSYAFFLCSLQCGIVRLCTTYSTYIPTAGTETVYKIDIPHALIDSLYTTLRFVVNLYIVHSRRSYMCHILQYFNFFLAPAADNG